MKEKQHKYADMYFSNINLLYKEVENIIYTYHLTDLVKSEIYGKTKQLCELNLMN